MKQNSMTKYSRLLRFSSTTVQTNVYARLTVDQACWFAKKVPPTQNTTTATTTTCLLPPDSNFLRMKTASAAFLRASCMRAFTHASFAVAFSADAQRLECVT